MRTQHIGRVQIDRLTESEGPFAQADFLLPDIDLSLLEEHAHWLSPLFVENETKKVIMSFHSLVIRTPQHVILVDCCVGNDKDRPLRPGWHQQQFPYLARLAELGLSPDDIDFVFCTHLHADHVGWNTRLIDGRWVPTFPNARYIFAKTEYDYWDSANRTHTGDTPLNHGCFGDSVQPIIDANQAELVADHYQFDDTIWFEPAPGHTPGLIIVHVRDGNEHAVLTGDVMHTPIQLANPELSSRFCLDPKLSRVTRKNLIERFADTDTLILPGHFPAPTAGHIVPMGNSFCYRCNKAE